MGSDCIPIGCQATARDTVRLDAIAAGSPVKFYRLLSTNAPPQ